MFILDVEETHLLSFLVESFIKLVDFVFYNIKNVLEGSDLLREISWSIVFLPINFIELVKVVFEGWELLLKVE